MRIRLKGKKCGMVQRFNKDGNAVACTLIHVEPNVVTQIKTKEKEGTQAIQLGFMENKPSRLTKPIRGHFAKAGVKPCHYLHEVPVEKIEDYQVGQTLGVELFENTRFIDVQAISKGKGYQGTMRLHGFGGGPAAHGSGFHRHGGSTGMRSTPGRCFPGGKRASRMGGDLKTVQSLEVVAVDKERSFILVKGAVPGAKGAVVTISPAVKKPAAAKK